MLASNSFAGQSKLLSFPTLQPMLLILLVAGLSSCGSGNVSSNLPAADTSCPANSAQIGIGDGFIQNFCGCGGTSGQIIVPPQTFTCNVSAVGTTVFFNYIGTQQIHQVAPAAAAGGAGTPTDFVASPISNPKDNSMIRVHAVKLDASGTYPFTDLYMPQLQGSIVVP